MTRAGRLPIRASVVAVLLAGALPALAALPPVYQRRRELAEIIGNPDVMRALRQQPIDAVEFVRDDLYRVKAGPCLVDVLIVGDPLPAHMVGPRRFHVEVGQAVCR